MWLLTFSLLLLKMAYIQAQSGLDIVVVVERENPIGRAVTPMVLEKYASKFVPNGVEINSVTEVLVDETSTEEEVCKNIFSQTSSPTLLVDTTRRPLEVGSRVSGMVKRLVRSMGIPTLSATYGRKNNIAQWEDITPTEQEYLVQLAPPGEYIAQAVRDIAQHQNLTLAGIFYDNTFVMDHKYSTLLENVPVRHIIHMVDSSDQISMRLEEMVRNNINTFFVLGSTSTIESVLEASNKRQMFGKEYAWYLITKDKNIPKCDCEELTAILMSPYPKNLEHLQKMKNLYEFPYDSEVDVYFYFDLAIVAALVVSEQQRAGLWPNSLDFPQCGGTLDDAQRAQRETIRLNTALNQLSYDAAFGKFLVAENGKNYQDISMKLTKLLFDKGTRDNSVTVGTWSYGWPNGQIEFEQGQSLENYTAVIIYQVTTIEQPPFVIKTVHPNGTVEFTGYCIDLINEIKNVLNFEYRIFENADKKFGAMDENNNWNGMIRDLIDKRAHIALGPISVMAERETVVDFTVPYYDLVGIIILMKKPEVPSSLFKFLTVLESNVWGCILAAYFFTSFLMFVFDRLSPYSFHNNREKYKDDDEKRDFTIKECLWFCMTSLTPQGGGEAPRNLSGRLVAATWWLFGFIIIASYTANLAAFLTVSRLDSPIDSLDDLAKQYKIKYAPQKDTSSMTYFERMAHIEEKFYEIWKNMSLDDSLNETERAKLAVWDYPVSDKYTKIWWTMKESQMPLTFEEGVQRVKASKGNQDGFAFIADSTQVKYATMTNCDLVPIGSEFSRKPLALAVQQGSPLKDQLSSAILKLLNQRRLEGLKEKWWNKNPAKIDCDNSEKQSDGISIANIGGVFIVIFIGVVLACITLAFEYWYYKKRRGNTRVIPVKDMIGRGHNSEKR